MIGLAPPWNPSPEMLKAALEYAALGIEVMPFHSVFNGACTCERPDCPVPGDHDLIGSGHWCATTEASIIEGWWDVWPWANVGALPRGIGLVFCVDSSEGGKVGFTKWQTDHGKMPDTVTALTGGGVFHYWLRGKPITRHLFLGRQYLGVRIISEYQYLTMPPSRHISGFRHSWARPNQIDKQVGFADSPWTNAMLKVADKLRIVPSGEMEYLQGGCQR